jgi:hypothetical protein
VDADSSQRLADFVKLEGFDNGDNELHVQAFISQILKFRSRLDFASRTSLASFCANGTKRLQAVAKNNRRSRRSAP